VADEPDLHARLSLLPQILQPVGHVLEAGPPGNVKHDEGAIGLAVVTA